MVHVNTVLSFFQELQKSPYSIMFVGPQTLAQQGVELWSGGAYQKIQGDNLYPRLVQETKSLSFLHRIHYLWVVMNEWDKKVGMYLHSLGSSLGPIRVWISSPSADAKQPLVQTITKQGVVFDYSKLKPWEQKKELESWILYYLKQHHRTIDPAAVEDLFMNKGLHWEEIHTELDKLLCYVTREVIRREDVEAVVFKQGTTNLWKWSEVILSRDPSRVQMSYALVEQEENIHHLIAHLIREWQMGIEMLCTYQQGGAEALNAQYSSLPRTLLNKKFSLFVKSSLPVLEEQLIYLVGLQHRMRMYTMDAMLVMDLLLHRL